MAASDAGGMSVAAAQEALWRGAEAGDVARIAAAVGVAGVDVNAVGGDEADMRFTSLGWAALKGHLAEFRALLAAGADPAIVHDGKSVVRLALFTGNPTLIREAVAAREAMTPRLPPLHVAACADDDGSAVAAVLAGAASAEERAALVSAVADVEDRSGSALHIAAACGNAGAVAALVAAGAPTLIASANGFTPLHDAAGGGHVDAIRALLRAPDSNTDAPLPDGSTPLWMACQRGQVGTVKVLLDAGADANRADKAGITPIGVAAAGGHAAVMELLLDHGADARLAKANGWAPLHRAAAGGHLAAVQLLLGRADVNAQIAGGTTALSLACQNGHADVVDALLAVEGVQVDLAKVRACDRRLSETHAPSHRRAHPGSHRLGRCATRAGSPRASTTPSFTTAAVSRTPCVRACVCVPFAARACSPRRTCPSPRWVLPRFPTLLSRGCVAPSDILCRRQSRGRQPPPPAPRSVS
jgi:ankyrin repeat protein